MTHYAHALCFNRLRFDMNLGIYDDERAGHQPVEVSVRLYFPTTPAAATNDNGDFFNYQKLCDAISALVKSEPRRLLEFMGMEIYKLARGMIDEHGGTEVKIWVLFNKCAPKVDHLEGGASFVYSDLPPGATTVDTPML